MEFEAYKLIHSVCAAEEGQEERDQEKETEKKRKRQNESKKEQTTCESRRIHLKASAGGEIIKGKQQSLQDPSLLCVKTHRKYTRISIT